MLASKSEFGSMQPSRNEIRIHASGRPGLLLAAIANVAAIRLDTVTCSGFKSAVFPIFLRNSQNVAPAVAPGTFAGLFDDRETPLRA
jgi:hypothetical protein